MLHFEFIFENGKVRPVIMPNDESEIYDTRIALDRFFQIENPCIAFSKKMKSGEFNGMSEDRIYELATITNNLTEAYWNNPDERNVREINILFLLSRMLSDYCDSFFNKS